MVKNLLIQYLFDAPEYIDTLANWHLGQWGYMRPELELDYFQDFYRANSQREQIPISIVASLDGTPVAMYSLQTDVFDLMPDSIPMFNGFYIAPDYRKQGIAGQMLAHLDGLALNLGLPRIGLFVIEQELQGLYQKYGWESLRVDNFRGMTCHVMQKTLTQD